VRPLPWFDSTLLAYAPKHRTRLLPDAYRDAVFVKANGQLLPTFLIDGMVAGLWSITGGRNVAQITLKPFRPLGRRVREALIAEAESLAVFCQPDAQVHQVLVGG
jgi:hypothetical protein